MSVVTVRTLVHVLTSMRVLLVFDDNHGVNGKGTENERVVDCEFELLEASPCDVECPQGLELPRTVRGSQVSGDMVEDRRSRQEQILQKGDSLQEEYARLAELNPLGTRYDFLHSKFTINVEIQFQIEGSLYAVVRMLNYPSAGSKLWGFPKNRRYTYSGDVLCTWRIYVGFVHAPWRSASLPLSINLSTCRQRFQAFKSLHEILDQRLTVSPRSRWR